LTKKASPILERIDENGPTSIEFQKKIFELLEKINIFDLGNVYSSYGKCLKEPKREFPFYTNYTSKFKDTLDYLFYNKKKLVPLQLLAIPEEEMGKNYEMPNERFPSDHVPVMAFFEEINLE